jgi:hypothetical protein
MAQDSNLFFSLGKPVKDEYGCSVGTVASFDVKPNGRIDYLYVEEASGRFVKHPAENLKMEGSDVILLSKIKVQSDAFSDQIPLIWRKDQALKELMEKKKISPEIYEDLHSSFDNVLKQLKSEAQTLTEEINKEIARCLQEVRDSGYALVHLEIEHEIGKIDAESYEKAFSAIQECMKRANTEKSDLETIRNKLSNILLGETPQSTSQQSTPAETSATPLTNLPEPPVVVYVKEIGQSGI